MQLSFLASVKRAGSPASTGLVIRAGSVELLSLQGAKVATRISVPIGGKGEPHLTAAIQNVLNAAGFKIKKLPVAFPTQDVLFRFFTMPAVPKAEWDTAVQFEVRKYIPFKTDSLVWDYYVVDAGAANKLEVIFAAMQREAFGKLQNALTAAGVQPTLMEPRTLSLARLVEPVKGVASGEFVCLVDIDGSTAHLAIVKNGVPYLARDIMLPAAADLPADAVAGAPGPIDLQAQRLLSELSVSVDFFTREYPSAGIVNVWLFGDEALIGPWCQWFSDQLRCPVAVGSSLLDRRIEGGLPTSFASAVGLLQAEKSRGGASVDFLKRSVVVKGPAPQSRPAASPPMPTPASLLASLQSPQMAGFGLAAVAILIGLWLLGSSQVGGQRQRLAQLQQTRSKVGWGVDGRTAKELKPIESEAQAQLGILKQIIEQRISAAAKLDALAHSLPDGIWLTDVSYEDLLDALGKSQARMLVKGACYLEESAREEGAIFELEERMKRHAGFSRGFGAIRLEEVRVNNDEKQRYSYGTFQLNSASDRKL